MRRFNFGIAVFGDRFRLLFIEPGELGAGLAVGPQELVKLGMQCKRIAMA